jgi:transketolase
VLFDENSYRFELGKGVILRPGKDVTIIATGLMVQMAVEAAELLSSEGMDTRVIDMHTIKPLDEALVLEAARETGAIVTSEEHNIIGGLGGAVEEYLSGICPVPVVRHGVEDMFGRSGKAKEVMTAYGLTSKVLAEKAKQAIGLKK